MAKPDDCPWARNRRSGAFRRSPVHSARRRVRRSTWRTARQQEAVSSRASAPLIQPSTWNPSGVAVTLPSRSCSSRGPIALGLSELTSAMRWKAVSVTTSVCQLTVVVPRAKRHKRERADDDAQAFRSPTTPKPFARTNGHCWQDAPLASTARSDLRQPRARTDFECFLVNTP